MLNFLTANNIMDMAGLDEKFSSMIGEQMDIRDKLKPIERRLATLKSISSKLTFTWRRAKRRYRIQSKPYSWRCTAASKAWWTARPPYRQRHGKRSMPSWPPSEKRSIKGILHLKTRWKKPSKSARAFTVSCGRNSGNSNPAGRRTWSIEKQCRGIDNTYPTALF